MKILFTRFPLESIKNGGAEKQTISLMRGLSERGHAVAFAGSCGALLEMCHEHGILATKWEIGKPPVTKWDAMSFLWRKKGMKTKLKVLLDQFRIQNSEFRIVMLSLSEKLLLTDLAVESGAKVFWIEHDRVGNWLRKNPWLNLLLEQSAKAKTIVVSELSKTIYKDLGWKNVITIPNGVETVTGYKLQVTSNDSKNLKPETRNLKLKIGCIARLSPEKGVDILIEAVKNLQDVSLTIVGDGPQRQRINEQTSKRIKIVSHVENINDVYSSIDVLVLPSKDHDPFGLVAAEAMMRGIPVIVTDQCGIADSLANGKDAIVVKAGSTEELRQAIERMQNAEFRMEIAEAGQRTAIEKFSVKKMVQMYEDVFTGKRPQ